MISSKDAHLNENDQMRSMLEQPPTSLAGKNIPSVELTSSIQNLGSLTRPMGLVLPLWPAKPAEPKLALKPAWNTDRERRRTVSEEEGKQYAFA